MQACKGTLTHESGWILSYFLSLLRHSIASLFFRLGHASKPASTPGSVFQWLGRRRRLTRDRYGGKPGAMWVHHGHNFRPRMLQKPPAPPHGHNTVSTVCKLPLIPNPLLRSMISVRPNKPQSLRSFSAKQMPILNLMAIPSLRCAGLCTAIVSHLTPA
jgi:hypothetical protein